MTFVLLPDVVAAADLQYALWFVVYYSLGCVCFLCIYAVMEYAFVDYLVGTQKIGVNIFPGFVFFCCTPKKITPEDWEKENAMSAPLVAP